MAEEYRNQDAVRKFLDDKHTLDPAVLLKSHINLESKLGRDKIAVPKTPEERLEVRRQLGAPEDPLKYELKKPENMPEGVTVNEDGEKFLRQFAVQNGWDNQDFQAAYDAFLKHTADQTGAWSRMEKENRDKCEAALKQEHGQTYGQFEGAAKAALLEFADADFFAFLDSKGLGNDPRMLRVFGRIGKEMLGEDKLKGPGAASGGNALNPAQIQAKIDEMYAKRATELFNAEHADHKKYADELESLFKMKTPA